MEKENTHIPEYNDPCYHIEYRKDEGYIFVRFFREFDRLAAERFREDALHIGEKVKEQYGRVLVLHDLSEIPEDYVMDDMTRAHLVGAMEPVDRIASYRKGQRIRRISMFLFDVANFLFHGKEMKFFTSENEAKIWLINT